MDPITGAIVVALIIFGASGCSNSSTDNLEQHNPEGTDGDTIPAPYLDGDVEGDAEGDAESFDAEQESVYQCINGSVNSCYSRVGSKDDPLAADDPAPSNVIDMDIGSDGNLLIMTGVSGNVSSNKLFSVDVTDAWDDSVSAKEGPSLAAVTTDGSPVLPKQLVELEEDAVLIPYASGFEGEFSGLAFLQPSDPYSPIMNNSFIPFTIEGVNFDPTGAQSILPRGDGILVGGLDLLTGRGMVTYYDLKSSLGPLKQMNMATPILTDHGKIVSMKYLDDAGNALFVMSNGVDSVHFDVIDLLAGEVVKSMAMLGCQAVDLPEMLPSIYEAKDDIHYEAIPSNCDGVGKLLLVDIDGVRVAPSQELPEVPRDAVVVNDWMVCMIGAKELFCIPAMPVVQHKGSVFGLDKGSEVGSNLCSMTIDDKSGDIFVASRGRLNEPDASDDAPCQFVSRVKLFE